MTFHDVIRWPVIDVMGSNHDPPAFLLLPQYLCLNRIDNLTYTSSIFHNIHFVIVLRKNRTKSHFETESGRYQRQCSNFVSSNSSLLSSSYDSCVELKIIVNGNGTDERRVTNKGSPKKMRLAKLLARVKVLVAFKDGMSFGRRFNAILSLSLSIHFARIMISLSHSWLKTFVLSCSTEFQLLPSFF